MTDLYLRPLRLTRSIWLLAIALLSACGTPLDAMVTPDLSAKTINVVATTGHVADMVRHIGGNRVVVTALMGPGVDPHLYKASANDVIAIQDADVVFYSGLHLEGRMIDLFERLSRIKPVYSIADELPPDRLRRPPEFEGAYDPHVWFDPSLWLQTADVVAARLGALDPASARLYTANARSYQAQIMALDAYAREQIATIPEGSRVLITAHDAFGYFGAHYGVEVYGLQGLSTASEAGAADIQALVDLVVARQIKAIFIESSVPVATIEAVRAAVAARGFKVAIGGQLFSDALGSDGTPEGTYDGMFRANIATIVRGLR